MSAQQAMLEQDIRVASLVLGAIPPEWLWAPEAVWVSNSGDRLVIRTHEADPELRLNVRVFLDVYLPELFSRISPERHFKTADLEGFDAYTLTVSGLVRGSIVAAMNVPPVVVPGAQFALTGILRSLWDVLLSPEPLRRTFIDPFGQAHRALLDANQRVASRG